MLIWVASSAANLQQQKSHHGGDISSCLHPTPPAGERGAGQDAGCIRPSTAGVGVPVALHPKILQGTRHAHPCRGTQAAPGMPRQHRSIPKSPPQPPRRVNSSYFANCTNLMGEGAGGEGKKKKGNGHQASNKPKLMVRGKKSCPLNTSFETLIE